MKLTANGYGCAKCGHDKGLHIRRCMACACTAALRFGRLRRERPWPKHPQWRVLSEDGTAYAVGIWKDGEWHAGSVFRAWRECRGLRRQGEKQARVVRR